MGQRYYPAALPLIKGPNTHCTGGWVGLRAWPGMEKIKSLDPTGFRTPDRPARNKSLYRPSYYIYIIYTGVT